MTVIVQARRFKRMVPTGRIWIPDRKLIPIYMAVLRRTPPDPPCMNAPYRQGHYAPQLRYAVSGRVNWSKADK
jgi:hypothetical protein